MPRAVFKNGEVRLLEPVPAEWGEGQELWVEPALNGASQDEEDMFRELDSLCATNDPEDDARLQAALAEAHREAKEFMRRRMGLA
ncbi:MAG TPA: hypothetical protein VG099_31915 [Gemmataceae bacterium]|jgi:hypothetical protein|nr:hypothetical protein [Gemmataceae bacterium]